MLKKPMIFQQYWLESVKGTVSVRMEMFTGEQRQMHKAMWKILFQAVVVILAFVIAVMRYMSSQDDHRLNQYLMYLRSRPFRRNAHFWGAHSMAPTNYKKRGAP